MSRKQEIVNLGMVFNNLDRLDCEDFLLDDIYYDIAHTIKSIAEDCIDDIKGDEQLIGIYDRAIQEIDTQSVCKEM